MPVIDGVSQNNSQVCNLDSLKHGTVAQIHFSSFTVHFMAFGGNKDGDPWKINRGFKT